MKDWNASVQYGDLKGTSAADGHENALFNMDKYLKQKGVDTDRYKPIGIDFYAGEGHLSFRFINCNLSRTTIRRLTFLIQERIITTM